MELFIYLIFFIIGTLFGSFFTLAVYRIPLHQDIIWKSSYCPNCNHKLGFLDLIPIISYIFLKGKCRYCGEKVRIRYLVLEILSGLVFTLFAIFVGIDIYNISFLTIMYIFFNIIYFCVLFIIGGIDKEHVQIQRGVLLFGFLSSSIYIIYVCTLDIINMYRYVMYLFIWFILILIDMVLLRKKLYSSYAIQISMLCFYMAMFSGEITLYLTCIFTLLVVAIKSLLHKLNKKQINLQTIPFGFYLCICNILVVLTTNLLK